jgi:hypothetical protein
MEDFSKKPNRILFFSRYALNVLNGNYPGGKEKQKAIIATELSKRGYRITLLDYAGKSSSQQVGDIKVINIDKNKGIKGLRFFTHYLPSIYRTLKMENPEIIYVRGQGIIFGIVAYFAKKLGIRLIWSLAHDRNADSKLQTYRKKQYSLTGYISKILLANPGNYLLKKYAQTVFCQNNFQYNKLKDRVNNPLIVKNIYLESGIELVESQKSSTDCLWIAQLRGTKGEDSLLKIAQAIPEINFKIIGKVSGEFKKSACYSELKKLKNIQFMGLLSNQDVLKEIAKAKILLNTSLYEGFSNVFLEAWAHKCIIISLHVDTDAIFSKHQLGYFANSSIESCIQLIKDASIKNSTEMEEILKRGKDYLNNYHSIDIVINRMISIFNFNNE